MGQGYLHAGVKLWRFNTNILREPLVAYILRVAWAIESVCKLGDEQKANDQSNTAPKYTAKHAMSWNRVSECSFQIVITFKTQPYVSPSSGRGVGLHGLYNI